MSIFGENLYPLNTHVSSHYIQEWSSEVCNSDDHNYNINIKGSPGNSYFTCYTVLLMIINN